MHRPKFDFVNRENMSMLTDFYELTMCSGYFDSRRNETASFDLFIRRLPPNRSYFLFAGLEQVLLYLKDIHFSQEQIDYLKELGLPLDFLEHLTDFKFTGEVWAVSEGTIVFPGEPLVRVTAPVIEAQLVETFLLNTVNLQTTLATKAARAVVAAQGRRIIEFGLRRTQGTDAGMKAARCAYLAGAEGTSNVLAGMHYGIPIYGTMAHSYVMFFDTEIQAFRAFSKTFPESSTFLIDTYDDLKGAKNAATVAKEMEAKGHRLSAIRLDSGNLATLSQQVRKILDNEGLDYVRIFASGDLDEYRIAKLIGEGARIDAFGVGTRMSTSADRPYVDVVYKLSGRYKNAGLIPTMKLTKGKTNLPGRKQIFRQKGRDAHYEKDIIGLEDEDVHGEPLLSKVMEKGKIIYQVPSLDAVREVALRNLSELPDKYKMLRDAATYPVELSPKLKDTKRELTRQLSNP